MSKIDEIINSLEPFVHGLGKAVLRELRESIAQPAQEAVPEHCDPSFGTYDLASMILSDCGHSSNNQRLLDRVAARIDKRLAAVIAASTQPQPAGEAEPDFWTACAWYEGGGERGLIPLPGYSNETKNGVKALILEAARKEGYKGTIEGRLMALEWEIVPAYITPQQSQPLTDEQIEEIWKNHVLPGFGESQRLYSPHVFARAIEAALRPPKKLFCMKAV